MQFERMNVRCTEWGGTVAGLALMLAVLCGATGLAAGPGEIIAWGIESGGFRDYGQVADTPAGMDFVSIAAGAYHSLGLKSDGSIVGWGWDFYGQASPPAGTDFVAISGGGLHSVALKDDGSLVSWGGEEYGQPVSGTPAGTDYGAISAGYYHSLALKSDGSIVAWGSDKMYGELYTPPAGTDYVAISAGGGDFAFGMYYSHSLALKNDGSLVSWGYDNYGQVSDTPTGTDFVAIAAGGYHSLALKDDGSIVAWGYDSTNQVSDTPAGTDFVAIAAGECHSLALKDDGSIVAWGMDMDGQASPPAGTNFVAIAAGVCHSLSLRVPPVPGLVNYQGRLNDSLGDPLDGVTVDLTLRFYNEALAGSLLLTVQQTGVQVSDGLFNVLLGSDIVTPGTESELDSVFQNHGEIWMSTEVGSDGEMTPRKRIGSVGYATRAGSTADLTHIVPQASAPANPTKGTVYMDDTTNKLMVYDGTTWQACW